MCGKPVGSWGRRVWAWERAGVWPAREERPVLGRGAGFGSMLTCGNSGPVFPKSDTSGEAENPDFNVKKNHAIFMHGCPVKVLKMRYWSAGQIR